MNSTSNPLQHGWVGTDDDRGTWDILWKCLITLVLSAWSTLLTNVPARHDTVFAIYFRKIGASIIILLMPEVLAGACICMYVSAKHSVLAFEGIGKPEWKTRHAFLANAGGFVLKTPDFPRVPVNAEQIFYLVKHNLIDLPAVDEEDIKDRNKVDRLLRLITLVQILWFAIDLIGRGAKHLPISCLEMSTAAFLPCVATAYWFAFDQPVDIHVPFEIETTTTMAQMVTRPAPNTIASTIPYSSHPLEFISRRETPYKLLWRHLNNTLRMFGLKVIEEDCRPITRIADGDVAIPLHGFDYWLVHGVSLVTVFVYEGLLLVQWNTHFPTMTEKYLWRILVLINFTCILVWEFWNDYLFHGHPALKKCFDMERGYGEEGQLSSLSDDAYFQHDPKSVQIKKHAEDVENKRHRLQDKSPTSKVSVWSRLTRSRVRRKWRNNSRDKDPLLDVPLRWILPCYLFCAIYVISRLGIWALDFAELRAMPSNMFRTVGWEGMILGNTQG